MLTQENIFFLILAYLIGSLPSAVWLGKTFYNKDVREYGSGNAGATNTFRVLGKKAGIPVLLMDVFKGWFAVYLASFSVADNVESQLAFGIAAVIGHLFPIYTGFRGGKGIATLLGFMIGVEPIAAGICALIFLISFLISKYVSLSSIFASIAFPLVIVFSYGYNNVNSSLFLFSIFVPILALITHQKNIERLIRGEENKAKFGKNK
ncbi:MAG: glycerol-3-phosphate 1-O-acyltransferase PlsY [Flavobacteriales bacterium]|jgi:acyl phosphate:glycerol-3-phosphate acyltransferase|nr:glycerol-3-phosphate 1-O-acyltransferase PlsY [Flavobacteriales bacterium]MBT7481196.1 glycerol-3-phosphate 1-O-acyltransferase PlsY [Flavobacteriales bacterium]